MTNEDVEEDLRVLREAKKATHHVYDTKKKCLVKVPDTKRDSQRQRFLERITKGNRSSAVCLQLEPLKTLPNEA